MSDSSPDLNELEHTLNKDLCTLNEWAARWLVKFNQTKNEVLLYDKNNSQISLRFGDSIIGNTQSHKHLGITFDTKKCWSSHIDNICKSALKHIGVLRKLKYTLSLEHLLKIYKTFILPILEYGCEVWDGCTSFDISKLEKVQLEAARLITGLPRFAKTEALYLESGLMSLQERRKIRKLCLFYKIKNGLALDFLQMFLPPTVSERTDYNLRNSSDYTDHFYRLESTKKSFIPSTLSLWNELHPTIQNQNTFTSFKNSLQNRNKTEPPPKYLNYGTRKLCIILTRLSHECSQLNADLFKVSLSDSPICRCGNGIENTHHFFANCSLYNLERDRLINNLTDFFPLTVETLMMGDANLSLNEKKNHYEVLKYIENTKRFA